VKGPLLTLDFLEINQSETRIAFGGHACQRIGTKLAICIKTFQGCFLPSFDSFGQSELPVVAMFLIGRFLNIFFFVTV
jgi:hypothetical protein